MQTFRTALAPERTPFDISHSDRMLCIGSCFTEHVGGRLVEGKFPTLVNPFGIVYNPVSMAICLEKLLVGATFSQSDLFENAGLWHSWEHHGRFSQPTPEAALRGIAEAACEADIFLKKTNRLLLTLGTAHVFALRDSGRIVANCHKMPASFFEKKRLAVAEVVAPLAAVFQKIKSQNADLQVVLTVSPVRHLRDGFVENQRSKATLLLACAELCAAMPDFVRYFPAYELLLDDLRDYRFFEADMLHPNAQAIEYVWRFFGDTFFSEKTKNLLTEVEKIAAAARHRPFHPDTSQHRVFAQAQLRAIERLGTAAPELDFSAERAVFERV